MRQIQAAKAKARLAEILDEVERGTTILITRHGRRIARLSPETEHRQQEIADAIARIRYRRPSVRGMTVEEIVAVKNEGRA